MKNWIRFGLIGATASAVGLSAMTATAESLSTRPVADAQATPEGGSAPDVWVCTLPSNGYWGKVNGIYAFSVATTSANAGNLNLNWIQNSTQHPVIAQNMYRLKNGVLEMVGMSWLKHGFCALQNSLAGCGNCPGGGGCLSFLQPGCADPYSASLNAQVNLLGPRSEVNATTGAFLWPHSVGDNAVPSTIRSRLEVKEADILPSMNPNSRWFLEGQYVHPQDAAANLDNNNATYREINVNSFNFQAFSSVPFIGSSHGMTAAIEGWASMVPGVQLVNVEVPGAGGGRFIVGCNATDNGNGTWHYEYAVFNMNADRSGGSFSVAIPAGVQVTNASFHDVDYHSGEPYSGTDWPAVVTGGSVSWATDSFNSNPNANAIRWSTMYNFRFDANSAPVTGQATLGLFKSGTPADMSFAVFAPDSVGCIGDLNGDGVVDGSDLATLLTNWNGSGAADLNNDGTVNGSDLAAMLINWGNCI